jgi:rSAM/selenodomain-associated transferase 1
MVDAAEQIVVAILTRAPSAGGKTRLFEQLGLPADHVLLTALLLDTIDAILPAGIPLVVCVTPAAAVDEVRALVPPGVGVIAQGEGDLGARMHRAFDDLFARGARGVVLVGSDLPGLSPAVILSAGETLRSRPGCVVLGPAEDGGYYLIGATVTPDALFTGIEWSTANVLARTEAIARHAGLETVRLTTGRDVDSMADLAGVPASAVRTRAWLRAHARRSAIRPPEASNHTLPDG